MGSNFVRLKFSANTFVLSKVDLIAFSQEPQPKAFGEKSTSVPAGSGQQDLLNGFWRIVSKTRNQRPWIVKARLSLWCHTSANRMFEIRNDKITVRFWRVLARSLTSILAIPRSRLANHLFRPSTVWRALIYFEVKNRANCRFEAVKWPVDDEDVRCHKRSAECGAALTLRSPLPQRKPAARKSANPKSQLTCPIRAVRSTAESDDVFNCADCNTIIGTQSLGRRWQGIARPPKSQGESSRARLARRPCRQNYLQTIKRSLRLK